MNRRRDNDEKSKMEKSSSGRCDSYESWNGISADIQAEEVDFGPGIVEIVDDDNISTCADRITVVYRIHNGRRQKRRWNRTQGKWIDKDWIDLGPA